MEENNKTKKPYNKKRHYYNKKNKKPVDDKPETIDDGIAESDETAHEPEMQKKNDGNRRKRDNRRRSSEQKKPSESGEENYSRTVENQKSEERGKNGRINDHRKNANNRKNAHSHAKDAEITDEAADNSIAPLTYEDADDDVPAVDLDETAEMESLKDVMMIDGIDDIDLMAEDSGTETSGGSDSVRYEVIGVRFGSAAKTYYFDPDCKKVSVGEGVIVETARGDKYGKCVLTNTYVPEKYVFLPLRKVIRIATDEDAVINEENIRLSDAAFKQCNIKIAEHGLDMKLIDATYTHDRSKLVFFFTAPTRVDFRELVKDLAAIFKTRIDLRQIGIRDEAKMIGGYGVCGRPLCCCSFLPNFNQVSIKMAKDQNLSLNIGKISGCCGRLMCCLKFEHKTYLDEARLLPPVGSLVRTPDGNGTVVEFNPIAGTVKVRVSEDKESVPKNYRKSEVTVLKRATVRREDIDGEADSDN